MRRKAKKILALLCAIIMVATTFLGNTYMKQAEASSEVTPVTLEGFENITISDFVDDSDNPMEEKEYTNTSQSFYAKDVPNFDKTLLSMRVKFNSGSTTNTIYLGGTGGYTGFNFRMQATTGGWMLITNDTAANTVVPYNLDYNRPTLQASDAGDADFTSFLNNEFVLQFSFEFGTPDANQKADLRLGVYINGELYKDAPYTISGFDMTKIGNAMFVTSAANESISLKSVVIETEEEKDYVTLNGFENITISDFVDASENQMEEKEYTNTSQSFYAKDVPNFDKTLLSMRVKFNSGSTTNTIYLGGTGGYTGFNFRMQATTGGWMLITNDTAANTVVPYNLDYNRPTLQASDAGDADFTSFLNNEFVLQFSFEFGTPDANNKADLKLGVYINGVLYNDAPYTISGFDMTKIGNAMFVTCAANESISLKSVVIETEEPEEPPITPPEEKDYVTLDGFENITISDFVDASENPMEEKEYTNVATSFFAKDIPNFDKTLLSMKVKFNSGSTTNTIYLGGTGGYTGFNFRMQATTGGWMLITNDNSNNTVVPYNFDGNRPIINASDVGDADFTSFLNNEFVLQFSFEFGTPDANNKADLKLGVYINGELYKDAPYTISGFDMTKIGNAMFVTCAANESISLKSVVIETEEPEEPPVTPPEEKDYVTLDGFENITISDFVDTQGVQMPEGEYPGVAGETMDNFHVDGITNFSKKLVSMKVKFYADGTTNRIHIGGTGGYTGFSIRTWGSGAKLLVRNDNGVTTTAGDTAWATIDASEELGVTSFLNNEFVLQMSFEYTEAVNNATDLTLGIYVNGNLCGTYTITGCATSQVGSYLSLYRVGAGTGYTVGDLVLPERQPSIKYDRITFSEFGVNDGVYGDAGDLGAKGDYLYGDSINKTVLCGDVRLSGKGELQLMLGGIEGQPNGAWNGMRLAKYENSSVLRLLGPSEKNYAEYGLFKTDVADVDFLNEEFELMWSAEIVADDEDRVPNDIKVGIWFDGLLYNNEYIIIPDCNNGVGTLFATYCAKEGDSITLNSKEEYSKWPSESFDKITFSDFGLETKQYDLTTDVFEPNKKASQYKTLDKVAFSGDFRFSSQAGNTIIYGSDGGWNGLRFTYNEDGSVTIAWYKGSDRQVVARVNPADAGLTSFAKQTFNLMISTEIVNNDGENEANDIKVGIWFNKVRFESNNQEYYIMEDWGQELKNGFGICGKTGQHVLLRNVGDYQKNPHYFEDISQYRGTSKTAPEAPVGQVFSGWYADAEYTTAIEPSVTSGSAWAKFVEEDVLSVKPQIKLDKQNNLPTTSTDLRFVTTVDGLDYRRISFYIAKEKNGAYGSEFNTATTDENGRMVYEKLYAIGSDSETIEYVPTVFSWQSDYFKTFTLTGIPSGDYNTMIKVTPYWITMDGTVVRGKTLETCVAEYGKNISQAVSVDYIGNDTMPITGFWGPYPVTDANDAILLPDYVTDEYFKIISDSGVNVIISSNMDYKTYPDLVKKALKLGEKYGVSIYVQDSTILTMTSKAEVEAQIANYNGYESFGGIYLVEEPGTSSYKTSAPQATTFQTIAEILNELDILTYVNLYPIVDTTEAGFWESIFGDGGIKQQDKDNYSAYVSEVHGLLNPEVMMWDYYPFVEDDSEMDLGLYFWNMAEIRRQAQGDTATYADDKPFWAYVQAGGNWNDDNAYFNTTNYYPNEEEFNWNMNTALAFGAQGIQYFPLIQPKHFAYAGSSAEDNMWDFNRNGLIGAFGNKTEWYDYAQKANAHVGAIDSVLMNSYSKQIIAVGNNAQNATSGLNGVKTSASYNELTSASGNALIGCFDYKGKTALYVVNYDYSNSGDVTLTFNGTKNITKIENAKETTTTVSSITLNMTAGEGILLVIE